MKGMCSASYMHRDVHYIKSANKLIIFNNNGGSARSCDMHVMSYAVESALLIQFPLFVAVTEHTK
jgi:hypothetical protein